MLDDVTLADGAECVNFLGRLAVCDVGTLAPGADGAAAASRSTT